MLGLKLRDEFLGKHMPGTAISLRTSDNQGAAQKSPDCILSITYPTADVRTALKSINANRSGRPIVLMGDRGRGKSHIMAIMHHAIESRDVVESWMHNWGQELNSDEMKAFKMSEGFIPISEPVHNHEYPLLWNLLFDRHPKGDYYRGQFEQMDQPYPPRTLLEKMFEDQPTCLILDEFQTWFTGLPKEDPKTGFLLRQWAYNFIQNLSEIATDRPEVLILVISVLNNQNDAFQQIHRQGPLMVDFRGPTAKQDRQRLLLHRLFENRGNIPNPDIYDSAGVYADERFRLLHANKTEAEKDRIRGEVFECWPFSPELVDLLEDHILLSQAAQETRDMIRILAQVYRSRGESVPVITTADFFVDDDSEEVQSLIDSIAVQAGQEELRQIAQRNLETVRNTGVPVPNARELISSIWMRSMSPGKIAGGSPSELHLDITRQSAVDDNAFRAELTLLIENSVNVHGDDVPNGPLWFGLKENPRSKVRACAKNDKLWQVEATAVADQTVYPGKDVEYLRKKLRHELEPATREHTSRIIVLGPQWNSDPWAGVEESDLPTKWDRPVLLVIPGQITGGKSGINACLGEWLAKHVQARRNTVRFLLLAADSKGLFEDQELLYSSRCSYLCSPEAWGSDSTYRSLLQEFDRPLKQSLKSGFNRVAVLRKWNYQEPQKCVFDVEKISKQGNEIPPAAEAMILSDLFDLTEFKSAVLQRAKESGNVGSLIKDLIEPPPPNAGEAIPFLGETKTYECVLEIAAQGEIVLNVNGTWIGRRSEDTTDADSLRYVRSKAFRTGQEMYDIQIGLPGAVGGGTVTGPAANTGGPATTPTTTTPGVPGSTGTPVGNGPTTPPAVTEGVGTGGTPGTTFTLPTTKKTDEAATGINLTGSFEKWGVGPGQAIDSTRIEFDGLTAQQVKQILQRIPSAFKGKLEITYREETD